METTLSLPNCRMMLRIEVSLGHKSLDLTPTGAPRLPTSGKTGAAYLCDYREDSCIFFLTGTIGERNRKNPLQ